MRLNELYCMCWSGVVMYRLEEFQLHSRCLQLYYCKDTYTLPSYLSSAESAYKSFFMDKSFFDESSTPF